ncbi:MAG: hypothetical protein F6K19_52075 [Cyanothece sp. SIO1E1]|nr:hypothetical protein [Cyanothece sp. SIO1E1]
MLAAVGLPAATVVYLKAMTGLLTNRLWLENGKEESVLTIRHRLARHEETIAPLLEYYRQRSQLTTINGSLSFAEVQYPRQSRIGKIAISQEVNAYQGIIFLQ